MSSTDESENLAMVDDREDDPVAEPVDQPAGACHSGDTSDGHFFVDPVPPQMINEVHPTVVKVEPERLGLAVARGERGGGFGGVEQLSRYLDFMRRDTLLGTVHGILAAQRIKPQARALASDRGISCVTVDYDLLRGLDSADDRLF
jgi:Endonuclease NucS